jgi:hypothetical protein
METGTQLGTLVSTASEAEIAEATLIGQTENHTIAAAQVFAEQRDSAAGGLIGLALVP